MLVSTRPMRFIAVSLLVVIANAYVFANGTVAPTGTAANSLVGRLITTSNRPVLVNGGEAITGAVIVSGTELTTPAAAGANVHLGKLGSVAVAPSSTVSIAFDAANVRVNVVSGYASVATAEGVKGTVTGLPANAANTVPTPAGGNAALHWGIAGVGIGSAALIWAIIAWNRANDARDSADAANASAASLASQLAALRTCLAGQTTSPLKLCTSF